MGQHKHNPNCQLAKEGKLPPKPKKPNKRAVQRQFMRSLYNITGLSSIQSALGIDTYTDADMWSEIMWR